MVPTITATLVIQSTFRSVPRSAASIRIASRRANRATISPANPSSQNIGPRATPVAMPRIDAMTTNNVHLRNSPRKRCSRSSVRTGTDRRCQPRTSHGAQMPISSASPIQWMRRRADFFRSARSRSSYVRPLVRGSLLSEAEKLMFPGQSENPPPPDTMIRSGNAWLGPSGFPSSNRRAVEALGWFSESVRRAKANCSAGFSTGAE